MTATVPVVEIANLAKTYKMRNEVHALRDVSLTVHTSDYLAIMGASGSGKSTLMNMIGLLDHPTSGSYRIRGEETSKLSKNKTADLRDKEKERLASALPTDAALAAAQAQVISA